MLLVKETLLLLRMYLRSLLKLKVPNHTLTLLNEKPSAGGGRVLNKPLSDSAAGEDILFHNLSPWV